MVRWKARLTKTLVSGKCISLSACKMSLFSAVAIAWASTKNLKNQMIYVEVIG